MRWIVTAVVAVFLGGTAARAQAGSRVGLVDVSAELTASLHTALEPWGIELASIAGPPPAAEGAVGIAAAGALARDAGVDALLWTTTAELWLFDVASAELSVRRIPLERDEATLAAIALSAKTMLRTTLVAPPAERIGAPPAAAMVVSPTRRWQVRVHAQNTLRWLSTGNGRTTEPRLGIAISWWPAALGDRAAVSLALAAGPGFAVNAPLLLARHTDTTLAMAARGRHALGRRLTAGVAAGLALHLTSLDGYAPVHDVAIAVTRVNTSVDAAATLGLPLTRHSELALDLGAALALRRQRYLVGGTPVLDLPLFEGRAGLELRVSLR